MAILDEISVQLQQGKAKIVSQLVAQAIQDGFSAKEILENGLLHGMGIVGDKFKNNEVFVPEVLVAARAMNMGLKCSSRCSPTPAFRRPAASSSAPFRATCTTSARTLCAS